MRYKLRKMRDEIKNSLGLTTMKDLLPLSKYITVRNGYTLPQILCWLLDIEQMSPFCTHQTSCNKDEPSIYLSHHHFVDVILYFIPD